MIIYLQDILIRKEYQNRGLGSKLLQLILTQYELNRLFVLLTEATEEVMGFYQEKWHDQSRRAQLFGLYEINCSKKSSTEIIVCWDEDEPGRLEYFICLDRCDRENIRTIKDLDSRVIKAAEYGREWHTRCEGCRREGHVRPIFFASRQIHSRR